jgi:hypothetical protein
MTALLKKYISGKEDVHSIKHVPCSIARESKRHTICPLSGKTEEWRFYAKGGGVATSDWR